MITTLHHVYHFPGLDLPSTQDKGVCTELAELFITFTEHMIVGENCEKEPKSGYTQSNLESIITALKEAIGGSQNIPNIEWFPDYGCAIIFHTTLGQWSNKISIDVIGLDKHKQVVHTGQYQYQFSSVAKSFVNLYVGEVDIKDIKKFAKKFQQNLAKASQRKGDQRSAAGGKQGHQRTPAFIHAILKQTLCSKQSEILPIGGLSDVGLHTGGEKRDTCFALVRSVYQWFLDEEAFSSDNFARPIEKSFDILLVHFDIYLMERALLGLDSVDATESRLDEQVNHFYFMLKKIAINASRLADKGYDCASLYEQMEKIDNRIRYLSMKWDEMQKKKYSFEKDNFKYHGPQYRIPDYVHPQELQNLSKEALQNLIDENLGKLSSISNKDDLVEATAWAKAQKAKYLSSPTTIFAYIREIENVFWPLSDKLLEKSLGLVDLDDIICLVDCYREAVEVFFKSTHESKDSLLNRMRSVELLMVSLSYCLIFNTVATNHQDILEGFGTAIEYTDLKYLVLNDIQHIEVMKKVATFLHRNKVDGMDLFSMCKAQNWDSPTFLMGERYANKYLSSIHQSEHQDAEDRVKRYWEKVITKQRLAQQLRLELVDLEREYTNAHQEVSRLEGRRNIYDEYDYAFKSQLRNARNEKSRAKSRVESKKREIKDAEKAPPAVIQPLPKDKSKAMKVLFFLYMPTEFQYLSRITLTTQQLFVPRPWIIKCGRTNGIDKVDVFQTLVDSEPFIAWKNHYNSNQICTYLQPSQSRKGNSQYLDVSMHNEPPNPNSIGPNHVDRITDSADGVWYPDQSNIRLVWNGGSHSWDKHNSGKHFNPFLVDPDFTASYFTEQLGPRCANLQWSLNILHPQPSQEHGNIPYASQHLKPQWLTKEGFLDFTTMRRWPHLALRKFCGALKRNSLPLDLDIVHSLCQQTLFQIGDLSINDEGRLQMDWRRDIDEVCRACLYLLYSDNLKQSSNPTLTDIYCVKPHLYKACVLLGQVSSYLSLLSGESKMQKKFTIVSKKLADSAKTWAGENCDGDNVKKVMFYQTAVLCLVSGRIDSESVATMLYCIVQAKNIFVNEKKRPNAAEELDNDENMFSLKKITLLTQLSQYSLCNILASYIDMINQSQRILSDALKSVVKSAPKNLRWRQEESSHVSFSANGDDGHRYSVNALTGVVLVDGRPPSQLPLNIINDPTYKRIFLNNNFEVVLKNGYFETINPVNGFYYRFHKVDSTIVIQESQYVDAKKKSREANDYWHDPLELIDLNTVQNDFPLKLKWSYSHWISRKQSQLLFREFDFRKRDIYYIHNGNDCITVPRHLDVNVTNWTKISERSPIENFLIAHDKFLFMRILERFESSIMMLTYRNSDGNYIVHFQRFGLSFTFDSDCNTFQCNEISGFSLSPEQHLPGYFHGFHQYLLLEPSDTGRVKVIIPFGEVCSDVKEGVTIKLKYFEKGEIKSTMNSPEEHMNFFTYDLHPRFRSLVGTNFSSRMYLAAIFAATRWFVPDGVGSMTGEEKAIELVRQCWVNRPLTTEEKHCLENTKILSHHRYPSLFLLCTDIEKNSTKYCFLHNNKETGHVDNTLDISREATAYHNALSTSSPRLFLQRGECHRCIGSFSGTPKTSTRFYGELIEIKPCQVQSSTLDGIYKSIRGLWITTETTVNNRHFPLINANSTALERTVYSELEKSWKLHCEEKSSRLELRDATSTLSKLKDLQTKVTNLLETIQNYILEALNDCISVQSMNHWHTQALYFRKLVNIIPSANLQDIARIACYPSVIKNFNPILSTKSQKVIKDAAVLWLELCTLEDKLTFLRTFDSNNLHKNDTFIQELVSERRWDSFQHPYWLVFEAEQGIRIRPEQFEVAKHLIENNGKAVQLNMGLGKTRVILPMLILYFSYAIPNGKQIPRLCIPSTLFTEVCNHFSNVLTASVTGTKLFTLPFQRDVEIDSNKIILLKDMVTHCWQERGFIVMAPEHRLSLQLKVKELHQNGKDKESRELDEVLSNYSWCDIIDEIDDVLHHRFQLIYSIGEPGKLPQVEHRWRSIQALLILIKNVTFEGVTIIWNSVQPEAYPTIFLDENIDIPAFREHIVNLLFENPPDDVNWLKGHGQRELISRTMILPDQDPKHLKQISEEHFYDILSLRGLLAFDLLFHCLKKRHRVDYGVNKLGRKRLAVPFRGADTPSKRAEFSHPDAAMTLTMLAYYDSGLTKEQMNATFRKLLLKGRNSKASIYNQWIEYNREKKRSILESIDHVDKIDLTNSLQVGILFENFHKNPFAINFWLNTCVFLSEVDQYPKSMVANSWHLAHNDKGHIVGFSGTNDNHQILPLQLKQHLPWENTDGIWKNLLSTNGRMLDTLIEKTNCCEELQEGRPCDVLMAYLKSCWEKKRRVDALIDAGALLAGLSNLSVAKFIVKECLTKHYSILKGVTFFDENQEPNGCWMILDRTSRCLPKDQSPLSEKETFALFDEPRCRGVDLKLEIDAVALLTLGKNMCKDKFMQAAGRMRQLKSDQRLIIVGEKKTFDDVIRIQKMYQGLQEISIDDISIADGREVFRGNDNEKGTKREKRKRKNREKIVEKSSNKRLKIQKDHKIRRLSVSQVLSWIMHNTVESIWKGLGSWSKQGIFYATESSPSHAILDDHADLISFYGKTIDETSILEQAHVAKEFHKKRTRYGKEDIIDQIIEQCNDLGSGYTILRVGIDEECERELEREVEEEKEEEKEVQMMTARSEVDWRYPSVFETESPMQLPTKVMRLGAAIRKFMSCKSLGNIGWSSNIFCTENFFVTIDLQPNGFLDNFLRIPECFVRYPDGSVLLLSDKEAESILQLFWNKKKQGYYFGQCVFESDGSSNNLRLLRIFSSSNPGISISVHDACSINLFNGECAYPEPHRKALKEILSSANEGMKLKNFDISKISGEPVSLVTARMKNTDYDRSDLEQVCIELACEFEIDE